MKRKFIWIFLIAIVLIGSIIVFLNTNYYQSNLKQNDKPSPMVTSSQLEDNSSLLEYSVKITGSVLNTGGNGYVIVEARLMQGEDSWEKKQEIFIAEHKSEKFEIVFDEAKLLDSEPQFEVNTYPSERTFDINESL